MSTKPEQATDAQPPSESPPAILSTRLHIGWKEIDRHIEAGPTSASRQSPREELHMPTIAPESKRQEDGLIRTGLVRTTEGRQALLGHYRTRPSYGFSREEEQRRANSVMGRIGKLLEDNGTMCKN